MSVKVGKVCKSKEHGLQNLTEGWIYRVERT